jgi:predicted nucleic acid-binding protein
VTQMATKVLDSWALIAFFEDEPAAEQVEQLLAQAADDKHRLLLSVVNWGEIYYNTMREVSQEAAEQTVRKIAALPIEIVGVADDLAMARQAAIYKATHKMAYADAFAAALAKEYKAELVTGDPEFKPLEKEIKINWLK